MIDEVRARFRALHDEGTFLMPNPHDPGSARLLESVGFPALATTSGGFAASLGQPDMTVSREQLIEHVAAVAGATGLPLNVDAEQCFPRADGGIARTVLLLAEAGAAGCSIEDWDPIGRRILDRDEAASRVAVASEAAQGAGLVLTARAENHLRGVTDLNDTIDRLQAYREAGADCVYAPALVDLDEIGRVVAESGAPVNVLLLPGGPTVAALAERGVRRISTGSLLALVAYGALHRAATHLHDEGALAPEEPYLAGDVAAAAFRRPL